MDCVFTVEVLDPFFLPFFHTEKQTWRLNRLWL